MSDTRKVTIESILESQIPSFLSTESPLFKEFLTQYYLTQTGPTGNIGLSNNLNTLKDIQTYITELSYFSDSNNRCYLIDDVLAFDNTIQVNSTLGFPEYNGLLKINDEIILYKEKTSDSFLNCYRGFSGVTEISDTQYSDGLVFTQSESLEHESKSTVENLNLVFYRKLFEKFKSTYLPDFERREFNSNIDLQLILSRARDFYLTKGSDVSFQILFEILYGDKITIFKPKENVIRTSSGLDLNTKNILVEVIEGEFTPSDLIGLTLFQAISNDITASASIYNVEYRPTIDLSMYEISLDSDSFIYDFISTKKTIVIEKLSDSIFVDSTIGFPSSGTLYVKNKNIDGTFSFTTLDYSGKTINKFLNITNITSTLYSNISPKSELIEDNLAEVTLENGNIIKFRILNVIENFDYSQTSNVKVNDIFYITSFGDNFSNLPEFNSWIYNYPTYHKIRETSQSGFITLYDSINFRLNEKIELLDSFGNSVLTTIQNILSPTRIEVNATDLNSGNAKVKIKRILNKSTIASSESAFIQNSYLNEDDNSVVIAFSGLPNYKSETILNNYSFIIAGDGSVFTSRNLTNTQDIDHYLLSGIKVYLNSNIPQITSGQYFVKKISNNSISLYKSSGDLNLSYANNVDISSLTAPLTVNTGNIQTNIGTITILSYNEAKNGLINQLLLKEFKVKNALNENMAISSTQIYNIEDAYNAFKS